MNYTFYCRKEVEANSIEEAAIKVKKKKAQFISLEEYPSDEPDELKELEPALGFNI